MMRHIELVKIVEIYDGKSKAEQLVEISTMLEEMVSRLSGVASYKIDTCTSMDPMDADLLLLIDFESREALREYDLDMNRIEQMLKLAEQSESLMTYDYEF